MGLDRWVEFGHMIYSINIYRALFLSQALVVGAEDTQMAMTPEEVIDEGRQVHNYQYCDQNGGEQSEVGVQERGVQGCPCDPKAPAENSAKLPK
jgi:hypothetical protein